MHGEGAAHILFEAFRGGLTLPCSYQGLSCFPISTISKFYTGSRASHDMSSFVIGTHRFRWRATPAYFCDGRFHTCNLQRTDFDPHVIVTLSPSLLDLSPPIPPLGSWFGWRDVRPPHLFPRWNSMRRKDGSDERCSVCM